ncbi:hypothetical protein [Nesterenkonia sandarakina]|uniref:Uncharacterized protein n=1 Tax=Nesterenkonia sandarakina TaxID=272918 RepID=A0A2T0YQZ2_9MICC|nr:hypothetical protein [Nesterenkonia sandarakina]PRZ17629.1 hypothetical protein BCL67_105176 [Nesterenkonia sandarakina]
MSQAHHSAPPPPPEASGRPDRRRGLLVAWAAALVMGIAAGGVAIWQVSDEIYTPRHTAQEYWETISQGSGSETLGFFDPASLEAAEGDPVDSLLLDGEPLARSTEGVENLRFGEDPERRGGAVMQFDVEDESFQTQLPMESHENTLAFFPDWELTAASMSQLEIDVPGAAAGGIAQISVNGEPVNLQDDSATLRTYVPAVVEIAVDSQWLVGASRYVVVQDVGEDDDAQAHQITLELEASDAAQDVLHEEVQAYLDSCAEQQVLMPAGCPMGINTPNQVATESINWQMPDPQELTLGFDEDGWEIADTALQATIAFDSRHFHDGASLEESHLVDFDLDIEVGASGEELIIAVSGSD